MWDSLAKGYAITRDGRLVLDFKKAELDGEIVLIGRIVVEKTKNTFITESAFWSATGLGLHGGDDLINF